MEVGKVLRVNMEELDVRVEEWPADREYWGGRGVTSSIIAAEVPARAHPLSKFNKLVIAPGLLGGTSAPCSGRVSVGLKSPLTGGIKESNAGGQAGQMLARLRIAAIIVEGKPKDPGKMYKLVIDSKGARLEDATDLKGLGNYATVEKLRSVHGDKRVSFMTVGQAGEQLLCNSTIAVTDPELRPTRHCGRGGPGAVMASKGLKAIVIHEDERGKVPIKDPEAFRAGASKLVKAIKEDKISGELLPMYGTNVLAKVINDFKGYPTQNFRRGTFEKVENISGEKQREIIISRGGEGKPKHACHTGCIIQCSRIYPDKDGKYLTKGPEYETIWVHGANLLIDDLDAIAIMDRLEDDFGLDTIEMGNTLAMAMEAGVIEWGDAQGAINLIKEVGKGSYLGKIMGSGAAVAAKVFGVERVPVVKNQAIPAYDPRSIKGIGPTYATSTMGADHTAGYSIACNCLNCKPVVDPLAKKGQAELSKNLQIGTAAIDCTGLCLFVAFPVLNIPEAMEGIVEMINAQYGWQMTADDLLGWGARVLAIEKEFNRECGFTKEDDRLPYFFETDPVPPTNEVFDLSWEEIDTVFSSFSS